jgi:hypothetical protein
VKAAAAIDYRELARKRVPHFLFEYVPLVLGPIGLAGRGDFKSFAGEQV